MPAPKSASELTTQRESLAISYYNNALAISDPNGKVLSRPRKGLTASAIANLKTAQTSTNLGISVFQTTYPNVTPDLSQYPLTRIDGPMTVFTSSGSFSVPAGYENAEVHLWGGGGVDLYSGTGAYVTGTMKVSPGSSVNIAVNAGIGIGRQGKNGGGYTGIYIGTNTQANYYAIAGGGGGGCYYSGSYHVGGGATWSGTAYQGGPAGTGIRSTAKNTAAGDGANTGGGGGSQTVGGSTAGGGGVGSALQGGAGSGQPGNAQGYQLFSAAGGGGYFGGAGGGDTYFSLAAGGGGSSYTGKILNVYGEDGLSGGTLPGGAGTKYYAAGYGGRNQGGRCVIIPFRYGQIL